jgi:hypothetical protein
VKLMEYITVEVMNQWPRETEVTILVLNTEHPTGGLPIVVNGQHEQRHITM